MAKKKTVKEWARAMVTYNGGVSMTIRGVKFLGGRVKPVTDRKLAERLKRKPKFSVQDEFNEVEVEPDAEDAASGPKATRTRRTRKPKG